MQTDFIYAGISMEVLMVLLSMIGIKWYGCRNYWGRRNSTSKIIKQQSLTLSWWKLISWRFISFGFLFLAIKGIRLTQQLKDCDDKKELMQICEKLGDLYAEVKLPSKALEFYLQQVRDHLQNLVAI